MTQAGHNFFKELNIFLMKDENKITQEDWIEALSVLIANLEYKENIDALMDGIPFDIKEYMKDNLSKEPFRSKAN